MLNSFLAGGLRPLDHIVGYSHLIYFIWPKLYYIFLYIYMCVYILCVYVYILCVFILFYFFNIYIFPPLKNWDA